MANSSSAERSSWSSLCQLIARDTFHEPGIVVINTGPSSMLASWSPSGDILSSELVSRMGLPLIGDGGFTSPSPRVGLLPLPQTSVIRHEHPQSASDANQISDPRDEDAGVAARLGTPSLRFGSVSSPSTKDAESLRAPALRLFAIKPHS